MKKIYLFSILMLCSGLISAQTYCSPITSTGCAVGDQIVNFSTTGGTTNISNLSSGCSGGSYSHITNQTLEVEPNSTFNFTVQAGPIYSQGFKIWIDLIITSQDRSSIESGNLSSNIATILLF